VSGKDETVPVVTDLAVRITENGDFVGLDLACGDGRVRSIALPAPLVAKMIAGFLWSGEEAARRGGAIILPNAAIGHLQSAAPTAGKVEIVGQGGAGVLDFDVGGTHVCIRLTREGMKGLSAALGKWFEAR
jgi:hypothetical protein